MVMEPIFKGIGTGELSLVRESLPSTELEQQNWP
jgi:hypothetical protein